MGFLSNQETIFLVHWSALRVTTLDLTQSSGEVARGGGGGIKNMDGRIPMLLEDM